MDQPPDLEPSDGPSAAAEPIPQDPLAGLRAAVEATDQAGGTLAAAWAWWWPRLRARPGPWSALALALVLALGGVGALAWSQLQPSARGSGGSAVPSMPDGAGGSGASSSGTVPSDSSAGSDASSGSTATVDGLVVQVAGAVVHPGVYHLPAGSRVADLLARAGGLAPDADGDRINQAASLVDGTMVYVPHIGQVEVPQAVDGSSGGDGGDPSDPGSGSSPSPPVDLNTATAAQLDSLPGVGPATATAILAYRRQHGPFHTVDELAGVPGIGPAKLAQIRPHARV